MSHGKGKNLSDSPGRPSGEPNIAPCNGRNLLSTIVRGILRLIAPRYPLGEPCTLLPCRSGPRRLVMVCQHAP